ncbi:MAG: hypothetical protein Q9210_005334 [Variospora velana]
MDLVFNGVDEPRVIVPHGTLKSSLRSCPERGGSDHTVNRSLSEIASPPYEFLNNDKQNIWELATISCPSGSPAANTRFSPRPQPRDLDFVRNVSYVKDTCQNPDASMRHGFIVAPNTLPLNLPRPDHAIPDYRPDTHYNAELDFPWTSKLNQLYWVGSTTGGNSQAHNHNYRLMHRERLVDFLNSAQVNITLLGRALPGAPWQSFRTSLSRFRNLFNVAFTRTVQCEEAACEALTKEYRFRIRTGADDAYKYRFVFDMDGNAWSGRYYTLLRSRSTVLKQASSASLGTSGSGRGCTTSRSVWIRRSCRRW